MIDDDEPILEKAIGTTIKWILGMCLTQKTLKKKILTKTEDCESFFNFFNPPQVPKDEEDIDEEEAQELQNQMEQDYEIVSTIKDKIIPHVISWFMGEAIKEDEFDGIEEEDDDEKMNDEDDDDGEEEDEEEGKSKRKTKTNPSKNSKMTCWKCGKTGYLKKVCRCVKVEQSHDEVYGCLKGGNGNSRGKRLSVSMVEEAWLSEKEEKRYLVKTLPLIMFRVEIRTFKDPFCLYDILKKHPVGDDTIANDVEKEKTPSVHANVMNTNIKDTESSIRESTSIRTGPVHNGGSILDVLKDMVRIGHSMGYNLEGCMKDIESIIGAQGVKEVFK
uniref:Nucleosome assembly protein 14-like n=1 Tax=Tanacetum cinerariifolium TaxID=118510 RepID=A0A699GJR4_TANCI|nr:nucleosome assembly protein 1;4-like [Tanacetum cinerariifolium]